MKKRTVGGWEAYILALAVSPACSPRPPPLDAGVALTLDAGRSITLQVGIECGLPDGGILRELLGPSPGPSLPPTKTMVVTANLPLHNYRIRILDELDRAIASDDLPDEGPSGLRYQIGLLSPLRPGHHYVVLLDAQTGSTVDDGTGGTLEEQRFEFHVDGEREKEVPAKRAPARRRHRRTQEP